MAAEAGLRFDLALGDVTGSVHRETRAERRAGKDEDSNAAPH